MRASRSSTPDSGTVSTGYPRVSPDSYISCGVHVPIHNMPTLWAHVGSFGEGENFSQIPQEEHFLELGNIRSTRTRASPRFASLYPSVWRKAPHPLSCTGLPKWRVELVPFMFRSSTHTTSYALAICAESLMYPFERKGSGKMRNLAPQGKAVQSQGGDQRRAAEAEKRT